MNKEDLKFLEEILWDDLLFYGELEHYLDKFLKEMFVHEFSDYGFNEVKIGDNFATTYWLVLSLMERKDLIDYGSSPRGAWLTEKGERFKKIIKENKHPIKEMSKYVRGSC